MIYLFDNEERLLKVVRRNAIKSALQKYALTTDNYVSDRLTVEMKALNDDEFEKVEYMAIQSMEDTHLFHYFYIAQKSTKGEISTFTGVQSGIEELRKTPVFDKRPKNTPAKPVINELLQGTNWQARFIADTTNHSTNFYYTSVFDALKKLCKVWGLEMQFFVEMNSNGLGARYIDFKKKIGEAVGKRVVYGHNALEILKEVERTNIFTALIGRGKGEQVSSAEESGKGGDGYGRKITFEDVVWSKAKGDPLDKPKGQKYLEIPEMTRTYGIKNSDGTMHPKIGFTEFNEEEDPNELIKLTYQTLINSARPQLTLKTSSVYLRGVKIGDTIRVVRHDKKLDYDTRIFEITFNRLNNQSSDIKLGDQIGESSSSKVQAVADKAVEEFINNEFNSFIENLPDFIKTADGFNTNWYGAEDPTKKYPKKVMINDIWYKPDPEHEGHKIMLRWTGEVWEEILRTYNEVSLREKIDQKFNELKQAMDQQSAKTEQQINDALNKSGLGKLADDAKKIAEQAKGELETIKQQNQTAQNELTTFKTKVQADLDGKPSKAEVTELIDGVKEKFTSSTIGGPNLIRDTGYKEGLKYFGHNGIAKIGTHPFYFNNSKPILIFSNNDQTEKVISSNRFLLEKNTDYTLNFRGFNNSALTSYDVFILGRRNGETQGFTIVKQLINGKKLSVSELEEVSIHFNSGDMDNAYLRFNNNGTTGGQSDLYIAEIDLYKGTQKRPWQPAPEDQEYLVTQAQAEFERTAQGLKTKLDTISTNFNPDGTTSEKFNRFLETKTAEGISRERAEFGKNYVAKNTYNEKINEIEQKFNQTDGQLSQFANYKNGLDGQYATITRELSDNKRAYSDFVRTSDVFVQAFGTVGSEIASNISRMVLNDQIFQTEVGKYSSNGGPNMLKNSRADDGLKYWTEANGRLGFTNHVYYFNGQKRMFELRPDAVVKSPRFIVKRGANYMLNMLGFDANSRSFKIYFYKRKKGNTADFEEKQIIFEGSGSPIFNSNKAVKKSFKFNVGEFDDGYLQFEYLRNDPNRWGGLFMTELDFYEGSADRLWQPSPDDSNKPLEAVRTQVTQLNNSWSVRNLNSAGDVLGQLNLNPDGSIKINEGLLSIGEKTYIKDGVIKKSMIGEAQIDTAHIKEIDASKANIFNLNVNNINGLNAEFIKAKIEYALVDWLRGKTVSAINGKTVFNLNDGRLSFHDNNTGIFRDEANASSQGMMFLNNPISLGNRTAINSRVVIGADRRDNDVNRNWNRGGFNGMIVDTIRGTVSAEHDNADKVTLVGDRIKFTHSYEYDPATNSNPYGWQINTWLDPTILPFGTNSRGSKIFSGDFKLLNKSTGTDGFWLREVLRTLINCWQHFANVNYTTAHSGTGAGRHNHTLNESLVSALRSELQKLQSYGV
nr:MAG TPA: Neck appendage protein [Caudoviricetes sp.]